MAERHPSWNNIWVVASQTMENYLFGKKPKKEFLYDASIPELTGGKKWGFDLGLAKYFDKQADAEKAADTQTMFGKTSYACKYINQ